MKIIYDCMGADLGAKEIIKGIDQYLSEASLKGYLVGDLKEIEVSLKEFPKVKENFEIIPTTEVIYNDENPAFAIKRKPDSSIVKGYQLLVEKKADGFLSAGSTGGLLAGGLFILGRIHGIERPALPVVLPSAKGNFILIDSGANMDCSTKQLISFAKMGKVYAEKILGRENPKVGLLNVGMEPGKGNTQVKEAYKAFQEENFNFIGNIEARDLLIDPVDIVVADGFIGNIILKNIEGNGMFMLGYLKKLVEKFSDGDQEFVDKSNIVLKELIKLLDFAEYGGTSLLGLKAPVIKAHGSSNAKAIKNATLQMAKYLEQDLVRIFENEFKGE
ncbi:MAG: phosphate acyltransferase PlsX [Tissierellia bacterium]|nr:phosphate acyltransferase PlsX [Tissierellia bacterium]